MGFHQQATWVPLLTFWLILVLTWPYHYKKNIYFKRTVWKTWWPTLPLHTSSTGVREHGFSTRCTVLSRCRTLGRSVDLCRHLCSLLQWGIESSLSLRNSLTLPPITRGYPGLSDHSLAWSAASPYGFVWFYCLVNFFLHICFTSLVDLSQWSSSVPFSVALEIKTSPFLRPLGLSWSVLLSSSPKNNSCNKHLYV